MGINRDSIRVLHVDDEPEFAELVATYLQREDERFEIESATTASDGLDRLNNTEFDCIISDHDMPGQNGIEFLESVRDDYPDLPFILFTGKGSEEVASEAISAGVTDYLEKGTGTDQYMVLTNRVRNAVEQFRSHRALDERNQELRRYKQMINSMHEAACIYDSEGRFELVNEYLAEWYDTTREELEGDRSMLIPQLREQATGDPYQELLAGERGEIRGEIEGEFPGHGYAVLEYRLTPLRVDGAIEGVVSIARDITDRRERQAELERKDRAMDAAPVGITISDFSQDDNPLIYINDCFTEVTGYTDEEALGRNCRFLQGANTNPEPVARMREAIDNTDPVTVELRNYRRDGTEFWNRVSIAPVYDDGEVSNWVGFQQDVTEYKEREQELKQYEAIIETIDDGVYVVDENSRFVMVNEAYAEMFGYDREELLGAHVSLIADEDVSERAQRLETNMRRDSVDRPMIEAELPTAGGDRLPLEANFTLLSGRDEEYRVGVVRDISERKAREQELQRQNERLEEFASVVSHDLRNPLRVAEGNLELARDECDSEYLDTVTQAHDRMGTLIEDLLTLAREGDRVSDTEPVDLAELSENCWRNVETAEATMRTPTDRRIRADRSRLAQLLENLIRNAVEHGGDDVTVTIGELSDGFFIEDDGSGIPEAERDEVFDAGYSTAEEGTGFGLRIVKQVTDAHGWEIRVTEGADGGARFEITEVDFAE